MDFEHPAADPALVSVARDWLRYYAEDGGWPDLTTAKVARLTPVEVIDAVERFWGGGLTAFTLQCADEIAERRGTTAPTETYLVILRTEDRGMRRGKLMIGDTVPAAVTRYVPRPASQGMGRLRVWFTDDFATSTDVLGRPWRANPLADRVLRAIGYRQPAGFWRGVVALSMEEGAHGEYPPMPADVLTIIEDLAGR